MASKASAMATICAPSGDGVPGQPVRVARAVPPLVVVADEVHVVRMKVMGCRIFHAFQRVLLDDLVLRAREGLRAFHDRFRDPDLADVVEDAAEAAGTRSPTPAAPSVRATSTTIAATRSE